MSSKKIEYSDLIEKNAIPTLIKGLEETEKALNENVKAMSRLVDESAKLAKANPLKGYKDLIQAQEDVDKVSKAVDGLKKAEKERDKAISQREKLEKRLSDLRKEEAKEIALIREQIKARNKELRQEAQAVIAEANGYKSLTKSVNEAQAEFKKLAAEQGINSKAAQEAFKRFDKLDSELREINEAARDGRRDVGRYRIATERLGKSMKALEAIGIITLLTKLASVFQQNSEGGAALEKVIGRVTVTLSVFVQRAVTLIPLITNAFTVSVNNIQILVLKLQRSFADIPEVLGGSADKVKELNEQIKTLESENAGKTIPTIEDLTKAFEGIGDEISKTIDKNDKLIKKTLDYRKEIAELEKQQGSLLVKREQLQAQADDDTKSLQSQQEGVKELMKVEEELSGIEVDIATKRLEIATKNAEVNKGSVEAQENAAQAFVQLQEVQAQAEATRLNNQRELRSREIDQLEADLDILLDISDRRKMINEKAAQNEKETFEDRAKAITDSNEDINKTFEEQIRLMEEQQKIPIDIERIINEKDTKVLNEYVKSLGLAERPQNRLREIIIERIQAVEDLRIAQEELQEKERQGLQLSKDIALQEEALQALQIGGIDINEVLNVLEEKRTQTQLEALQDRLDNAKEGSEEFLKIQQELNNKLLEQAQKQADKEKAIDDKKQAEKLKNAQNAFTFLENLSEAIQEKRLEGIDKAIEDSAQRESQLVELAKGGTEEALKTLEAERQKQAELALKREKELERQARKELLLTATKIYGEKVASGTPAGQALAETGSEILALESFVKSLPAFYEGTEDTGKGGKLDDKGGFHAVLHPHERVMPEKVNAIVPKGMSNLQLALAGREHAMRERQGERSSDKAVVTGLAEVKRAIESKPVVTDYTFDKVAEVVTATIEQKGKTRRVHKKLGI